MANDRRECGCARADETSLFVELCCGEYDVEVAWNLFNSALSQCRRSGAE